MGNKSGFVFFLFVPFLSVCCNPVLYPEGLAYVEVNQNLEYLCVHSTIAASSTVLVNWIEDGIIKGTVDFGCNNILNIVNSTLYSFACPSITNYTWTILNVQNDRNGTSWKCEIAVNNPTYQQSNEGTIYVTVPIASVEINDSATVNITDDRQYTFVSITSNGRPESDVKWFLDPRTPNDDSDDILIQEALSSFDFNNEVTFSNFRMIGNQTYNDWQIYCAANNTASMSPVTSNRVTIKILATILDAPDTKGLAWWIISLIVLAALFAIGLGVGIVYWKKSKEKSQNATSSIGTVIDTPTVENGHDDTRIREHEGSDSNSNDNLSSSEVDTQNLQSHQCSYRNLLQSSRPQHADNTTSTRTTHQEGLPTKTESSPNNLRDSDKMNNASNDEDSSQTATQPLMKVVPRPLTPVGKESSIKTETQNTTNDNPYTPRKLPSIPTENLTEQPSSQEKKKRKKKKREHDRDNDVEMK